MLKLNGIIPPIATPFDHNGDIYTAKLRHNIEQWNRTGLTGYVVTGSTGESVLLSSDEKKFIWEEAAKAAASDKLLIAGSGAQSARETVKLTNAAADLGYKAALIQTPYYFRNQFSRPESQILFFRTVADQAKIPVIIYNWPQITNVDLPAEAVNTLSEHPNIIGIKESSGNIEKVMQMVRETADGFQVTVGSAPTLHPSLMMGAVGGILAFSNAAPYACVTIWEAHRTRDMEAAADWQRRIARAARLVTVIHGIPGLKHAMDLNGYYGGPPRLPFVVPSAEAKAEIEAAFDGLKG